MMATTTSMKELCKDKVRLTKASFNLKKNISMTSTAVDFNKNYSIINPRSTSPSGYFN
jgi:hypothetical protein